MREKDILNTDLLYAWAQSSDESFYDTHCHAEYELYYFISGDIEYRVKGRCYILAPDSLLLIPPNCFHGVTVKSTGLHRRVSIHFSLELLDEAERKLLLKIFDAGGIYYPDLSRTPIGILVQSVLDCKNMESPLREIALKHRAVSLLTHIYQIHSRDRDDSAPVNERIQAILWYINSNLQKDISLEQITRRFQISKNHLNVLFRRETGTTIHQYIRIKRLALARQEMRNGCSAEETAYKTGFNDYSNFYRAYKAFFGIMPTAKSGNH